MSESNNEKGIVKMPFYDADIVKNWSRLQRVRLDISLLTFLLQQNVYDGFINIPF